MDEPVVPPVVEVEELEVLGVCAGFEVSVLEGDDVVGDCVVDEVALAGVCVVSVLLLGIEEEDDGLVVLGVVDGCVL